MNPAASSPAGARRFPSPTVVSASPRKVFPIGDTGAALRQHDSAQVRAVTWDRSALLATLLTVIVGAIALVWSFDSDWILSYSDANSHLNIARRVLDNRTPSIAQLGTVWLPLPHILMQPFIVNSYFWRSGLAGSLVGLPCFVIAAVMLFQTVRLVVHYQFAAWIALLVFISNPNALYLQTTALTEPVLLMSLTASTYYLVRWSKTDATSDLIKAALIAVLAVGSRYDGWFFALTCGAIVCAATLLRWRDVDRAEGTTLAYLAWPVFGMFLWLFYNWLIFGDPLAFQHGKYSAAFQQGQYAAAGLLPTKSHLLVALTTYSGAVLLNLGSLVAVCAAVGLVVYISVNRLRPGSFAAYSFLSAYVFNVIALYLGQTILTTPISDPPGYFNTRYGLVVLPAATFFIGYLADFLAQRYKPLLLAVVLGALLLLQGVLWAPNWPLRVVTIADGLDQVPATHGPAAAGLWFRHHYDGGGILYNDAHSEFVHVAGINMREYYLIGPQQSQALADPSSFVKWIVLEGPGATDPVDVALAGTPYIRQHYALQFSASGYDIYRRIGSPHG